MIGHTGSFAIAVSAFFAVLMGAAGVFLRRAHRLSSDASLEALLDRLTVVDRDKVAQVALDQYAGPDGQDGEELESWQVWELLGGMNGLQALAANCEVLIDLACYVQQWYPEALPVAEQLRLNAREIQWHLERLKGAESRGHLDTAFADYARGAVTIYYGMTQRVIALYEASRVPGWNHLQEAL